MRKIDRQQTTKQLTVEDRIDEQAMSKNYPERDRSFSSIEERLNSAKCVISCAAIALTNAQDEEVIARVESVLYEAVARLDEVEGALDRFNLDHLKRPKIRAARL